MTGNQINYARLKEEERANRVNEDRKEREFKESAKTQKSQRFSNYANPIVGKTGAAATLAKLIGTVNDPAWYNNKPSATDAAASLNFLMPLGSGNAPVFTQVSEGPETQYEPGIAIFQYVPTLPHTGGEVDSTFMRAFQHLYMETRRLNSGSRNYTVANQAQFVMATQSIITLWMEGYRAYKSMMTYTTLNRYQGYALTEALGFDPEDFRMHLADFRAKLETIGAQISKNFPVPGNLSWFYRSVWLASNVFSDIEDVDHGRYYAAVPGGYYEYGDVELFSTFVPRPSLPYTFETYSQMIDKLFDKLLYSEDAGIIAGDMLKAFGDSVIQKFPEVKFNETLTILCDDLVRAQFNNATNLGMSLPASEITTPEAASPFNIYEDKDGNLLQIVAGRALSSGNDFEGTYDNAIINHYCNSHKKDLKPAEVCEILMLKAYPRYYTNTDGSLTVGVDECATEVITDLSIYHYGRESEEEALSVISQVIRPWYQGSAYNVEDEILLTSRFNKVIPPKAIISHTAANNGILYNEFPMSSIAWPFYLDVTSYRQIKNVAVASMLGLGK